jgi:hypothetical protein
MATLGSNPLFLNLLVWELKQMKREQHQEWIERYCSCCTLFEMCDKMVSRWETDYDDSAASGLVIKVLILISVNRNALTENDIVQLLNVDPIEWSRLYLAMISCCTATCGFMVFKNHSMLVAVLQRYFGSHRVHSISMVDHHVSAHQKRVLSSPTARNRGRPVYISTTFTPNFNSLAAIISPSSLQHAEYPSRMPDEVCQAMCIALLNASVHRFHTEEYEIAASWLHSASSLSAHCRELVRMPERLEMEIGHVRMAIDDEVPEDDAANVALPAQAAHASALRQQQLSKLMALIYENLLPRQGLAPSIYKGAVMARTAAPGGVHQSAGSVASEVENVLTPAALGNTFSLTEKREGMTAAERQLVSRAEDVSVYFTTVHLLEVFRDAFEKASVYDPSRALGYAHAARPRLFGPSIDTPRTYMRA